MAIEKGDVAPNFTLKSTNGEDFTLSEKVKNKPVLINFYVGDFGINCTNYMSKFVERFDELESLGITMVGINNDSQDSHDNFKKRTGLLWDLLFDDGKKTATSYGSIVGPGHMVSGFTNREFFLVNEKMEVIYTWKASIPKELPDFDSVLNGIKESLQ